MQEIPRSAVGLASGPLRRKGIHCTRMREVYGASSSIIRRIRGGTRTEKVY